MGSRQATLRIMLLASVSAIALTVAVPEARAGSTTAPVAVVKDTWQVWAEGGAFQTGRDPIVDFGPPLSVDLRPQWGWEAAAGFDRKFGGTPWHVSAQVRYGAARSKWNSIAAFFPAATATGTAAAVNVTAQGKEHHWLVDFAVGRDIGIGNAQATLGVRIAELQSRWKGTVNVAYYTAAAIPPPFLTLAESVAQRSKFVGVGPRVGLEGSVPLGHRWTVDWLAGAAALFGTRSFDYTVAVIGIGSLSAGTASSDHATIFNLDAQAGLSYWFTPNAKVTASYRFDGYWNALPTTDSTGNIVNIDRFYYGPMLRLTVKN